MKSFIIILFSILALSSCQTNSSEITDLVQESTPEIVTAVEDEMLMKAKLKDMENDSEAPYRSKFFEYKSEESHAFFQIVDNHMPYEDAALKCKESILMFEGREYVGKMVFFHSEDEANAFLDKKLKAIDTINMRLRKAYAIADVLNCKSDIPLQNGSLQELGEDLCNHIQSAKTEFELLQKNCKSSSTLRTCFPSLFIGVVPVLGIAVPTAGWIMPGVGRGVNPV